MKTYNLEFEQFIDLPLEDVFGFFSKPENLSLITPSRLKFDIITPTPLEMKDGQLIDSQLSKSEIFLIKRSFLNVWKRIRHRRIQYPSSKNNTFN